MKPLAFVKDPDEYWINCEAKVQLDKYRKRRLGKKSNFNYRYF